MHACMLYRFKQIPYLHTCMHANAQFDLYDQYCNNAKCGEWDSTFIVLLNAVSPNVNECALGTDNCSRRRFCTISLANGFYSITCTPVATCTDNADGFECNCIEGFEGDGVTCSGMPFHYYYEIFNFIV